MARDVPLGKEIHLAAQERFVVRRQLTRACRELPADQRIDRVAHQRAGVCRVQLGQIRARAQVGEKQEARAEILRVHCGGVHARVVEQPRDAHERAAVLFVRRRIHRDESAAILEGGAKVAPEARVFRSGGQCEARAAQFACQPALQQNAPMVAVYH